jgi:acetylglutamate kinase
MMRVVKIGGRAQGDPRLPLALAEAARDRHPARGDSAMSASLCIVHGGGDDVSSLQRRLALEPKFNGGRRVTSEEDLQVVRMVLSGTINKRLVSLLLTQGVRAVGISGEDAMLFTAHATDPEDMGRVGGAIAVNPEVVLHLLAGGFVPVISPLARDADVQRRPDGGLNVNGDDAAAALAAAMLADELVLVADVAGVLESGEVLASLDLESANALIANGMATGGMAAKLEAAAHALQGGVAIVRITGIDGIGDAGAGTRLVLSHSRV